MIQDKYVWFGIAVYLATMIYAFWASQRSSVPTERHGIGYDAIGTRRYGPLMVATTIVATMLGPADAMALSQQGLKFGLVWALFPAGAALAQLVAGLFFVAKIREQNDAILASLTLGDIFAKRFGKSSQPMVGLVIFAQSIAFSAVLILAGGQVLSALLGISANLGMALTAIFVAFYTAIGGMNAVIDTDRIQGIFIGLIAFILIPAIIYMILNFSPDKSILTRPAMTAEYPLDAAFGVFLAYFLGELLLPAYSVRALLAKDGASAKNGFLIAAIVLVVWYVLITLGGSLGAMLPESPTASGENLILVDVLRSWLSPHSFWWHLVTAAAVAGLLALIHSTYDSFLNVGGVAFGRDVMGTLLDLDEEWQSWIARISMITISAFGLLVASLSDNLIDALLLGYTIWVPTLLVPFIFILRFPNRNYDGRAFWGSVTCGASAWVLFEYVVSVGAPSILLGAIASALAMWILTRVSVISNSRAET